MIVYTEARQSLRLGPALAQGGEATVYRLDGRTDQLAKLYARPGPDIREKLAAMCANPPADPTRGLGHASIAWPIEILQDARGACRGYLMPHITEAVPIVEVFNPRRRARVLPGFQLPYLLRTARNLASALAALHARDYVVGDLSERNVLVTPRALVTLIDADSFQVERRVGDRIITYPCPVGRLEYTPPELQGQAFRGTRRGPEHDAFGLAVLIFQLLMGGSHPYRGLWRGEGEAPPIEVKIARGLFPWAAEPLVAPPPQAEDPAHLHPLVREAFARCFIDGHATPALRPGAEAWAAALAEAEQALTTCRRGHAYSGHLRRCPDCAGSARGVPRGRFASPGRPPRAAPSGSGPAGRLGLGLGAALAALPGALRGLASPAPAGPRGAGMAPAVGPIGLPHRPAALLWLAGLALGSALVAVLAGALLARLFEPLAAWLAAGAAPGETPAGLWAALVGGWSIGAVGVFRGLELPAADLAPRLRARAALLPGAAGLAGWALGWIGAGLAVRLIGLPLPTPTLFAAAFGAGGAASLAGAAGWTIAWATFGALGGAVGGLFGEQPAGRALTGAVFGAAGWAAVRLVSAFWGA